MGSLLAILGVKMGKDSCAKWKVVEKRINP